MMDYPETFKHVVILAKNAEKTDTQWKLLIQLPNQRKFWLHWYNQLVNDTLLPKIEELSEEEKLKYWKFVCEETKETELTKEDKIDLVKIIWTINYLSLY